MDTVCALIATSRVVKKDFEGESVIKKEQVPDLKVYALKKHCRMANSAGIGEYLMQV